jgi:hypothetical protein
MANSSQSAVTPEQTTMQTLCLVELPAVLRECGVDQAEADAIGADILARARAFAALDDAARNTLVAPFIEEVTNYEPRDVSPALRAAVTVVVRNSLLETVHAAGLVSGPELRIVTAAAARPLAELLTMATDNPPHIPQNDVFTRLPATYPRAWAALTALADTVGQGGRRDYRLPDAPVPVLPTADEVVAARRGKQHLGSVVESAITPAFNQQLVDGLRLVITHQVPFYVPSLSRVSRNMDKLLRVMELLLARDVPIVTTNYLIRSYDVWVRRRLVQPDNYSRLSGLDTLDGLSGSHRKLVQAIREGFGDRAER